MYIYPLRGLLHTSRSEEIPLRDMLSLGALGMGPGWPGKVLPQSPPPSSLTMDPLSAHVHNFC